MLSYLNAVLPQIEHNSLHQTTQGLDCTRIIGQAILKGGTIRLALIVSLVSLKASGLATELKAPVRFCINGVFSSLIKLSFR